MLSFWTDCASIAIKTIVAAVVLFALARLMGKKQISQLTFFDYIVGISIGSVAAAMSVDQRISIHAGITCMILWALFPITFSFVSIHSMIARRLLDGTPKVLIQNGKIIEKNLRRSKFTVNDLLEELRIKDVFSIAGVEFAIIETSGKLSVLKKASKQPVSPADMNLNTSNLGINANIIIDGKLMRENMAQMNIDEHWLNNELRKNNIGSVHEVLLACCDSKKILHIDKKNNDPDDLNIFQ
jgi:uncharacterized membrane protein YcaP (DUF421 family)